MFLGHDIDFFNPHQSQYKELSYMFSATNVPTTHKCMSMSSIMLPFLVVVTPSASFSWDFLERGSSPCLVLQLLSRRLLCGSHTLGFPFFCVGHSIFNISPRVPWAQQYALTWALPLASFIPRSFSTPLDIGDVIKTHICEWWPSQIPSS